VPTDAQILAAGTADAPLDYRVPNAQEILLKAVNANFDGSGAAGDFLPAVVIESDGGVVIARAIGQAVTAGDSAEVSFFPRVGSGSGSPATSFEPEVAYYETTGVASGSFPGNVFYNLSLRSTSSPGTFGLSSGFAQLLQSGAYRCFLDLDYGTTLTWTAGAFTEVDYGLAWSGGIFPAYTVGQPNNTLPVPADNLLTYTLELSGEFVVDATARNCRPYVRGPAVAPAPPDPTGYLVIWRTRPLDWIF